MREVVRDMVDFELVSFSMGWIRHYVIAHVTAAVGVDIDGQSRRRGSSLTSLVDGSCFHFVESGRDTERVVGKKWPMMSVTWR